MGMSIALNPADQEIIDGFPVFTAEDVERVNELFAHYVFFTTAPDGGRYCECSGCRKSFRVEGLPRTITPEWRAFMAAKHNDTVRCPKCGREAKLKNKGICKSAASLEAWGRVILFHVREDTVYAQAYFIRKRYGPGRWRPEVEYLCKAIYTFRPGEARGWRWRHNYNGLGIRPSGTVIEEGWDRMKEVCEPWSATSYSGFGGYYYNGYHTIGLERLKDSFLKYCVRTYLSSEKESLSDGEERFTLMRYLAAAAQRPQIEMLEKMGLYEIVNDLVIHKRKLSRDIKWNETDPRKAFGLTGPELKEFAAVDGSALLLRSYKLLKKAGVKTSFSELNESAGYVGADLTQRFFRCCAAGHGVRPMKVIDYLKKQTAANGCYSRMIEWMDYVEAAKYCGYALDDPQVLLPKKLKEAHDGAVETDIQLRHEAETRDDGPYQRRYQSLMERYGFDDGDFFIRAPSSSREIITEGKTLHHCVGRYAGRHASGQTTILFMRRKEHPFLPAWTIEMRGEKMIQVQGRSDLPGSKPKAEAKQFLDQWLEWVAAGSKRDKSGKPKLPKKKEGNVA